MGGHRGHRAGREHGAHHHGPVESIIYVVSGRARMRWGERLEYVAEAGPGDFIYVPPDDPHQEINAEASQPLSCVVVRSGQEPVVVNLDLPRWRRTRNEWTGSTTSTERHNVRARATGTMTTTVALDDG